MCICVAINESFFEEFHNYKLEWQPDVEKGYVRWYIDAYIVLHILGYLTFKYNNTCDLT
jgi:beta-glucanase (GH16 family)